MSVFHGLLDGSTWHPPTIGADPGTAVGVRVGVGDGVRVAVGVNVRVGVGVLVAVLIETIVSFVGTRYTGVPVTVSAAIAAPSSEADP